MAARGRKDADEAIIAALVGGASRDEAAEKAGVGTRTVYRRLEDPEFGKRLLAARAEVFNKVASRLMAIGGKAIDEVERILEKGSTDHVRLAAARAVLDRLVEVHQLVNLQAQLDDLQQRMRDNTQAATLAPAACPESPAGESQAAEVAPSFGPPPTAPAPRPATPPAVDPFGLLAGGNGVKGKAEMVFPPGW